MDVQFTILLVLGCFFALQSFVTKEKTSTFVPILKDMKTLSIGFFLLFLCGACSNGKDATKVSETVVLADSTASDSLTELDVPDNLDGTFDDFVYTYASDKQFQLHRTHFPLPYTEDNVRKSIPRTEWIHDALYTEQEFYNMLFDSEADMDYEKNTDVDTVYVAWLFLDKQKTRRYHFHREQGRWMLQNIEEVSLKGNPNEDFLLFFHQFCNDSIYQRAHVSSPLKFVTTDPDDDFKVMEAFISVDQWFAFRPSLPKDKMTNICYGQPYSATTRQKVVTFRGIGSGYSNTLFFTRDKGSWRLSAYEDLSN